MDDLVAGLVKQARERLADLTLVLDDLESAMATSTDSPGLKHQADWVDAYGSFRFEDVGAGTSLKELLDQIEEANNVDPEYEASMERYRNAAEGIAENAPELGRQLSGLYR